MRTSGSSSAPVVATQSPRAALGSSERAGRRGRAAPWLLVGLCLVLIGGLMEAAQARRVALLVGNSLYDPLPFHPRGVPDVVLLGELLRDELGFDHVQIEKNLSARSLDAALVRFSSEATRASTAVFYFTGLGQTDRSGRCEALMPSDAPEGPLRGQALLEHAVTVQELRERLLRLGAPVNVMVVDGCHLPPAVDVPSTPSSPPAPPHPRQAQQPLRMPQRPQPLQGLQPPRTRHRQRRP